MASDESAASTRHSSLVTCNSPVPPAPWNLTGSALILPHFSWTQKQIGVRALVHYDSSPVGRYNELALAILTRRGATVIEMPVTSELSMLGGRRNWGYPKTLADLHWQRDGNRITFTTAQKRWRARIVGPKLPLHARLFSTQYLENQAVRVPCEIKGVAQIAFCGRQVALFVNDFSLMVSPPLRTS